MIINFSSHCHKLPKNLVCSGKALLVILLAKPSALADVNKYSTISGKQIYQNICASCHGINGEVTKEALELFSPPPSSLRLGPARAKKAGLSLLDYFYSKTAEGGENMFAYKYQLTPEQIKAVVKYIAGFSQELSKKETEEHPR